MECICDFWNAHYRNSNTVVTGNTTATTIGHSCNATVGASEIAVGGLATMCNVGGCVNIALALSFATALTRAVLDGKATKVYGQEDRIGALRNDLRGIENTVGTVDTKIDAAVNQVSAAQQTILASVNKAIAAENQAMAAKIQTIASNIEALGNATAVIVSAVKTVATNTEIAHNATAMKAVRTTLGSVCTEVLGMKTMI
jgi:methyl-accepting chemotaxis protein